MRRKSFIILIILLTIIIAAGYFIFQPSDEKIKYSTEDEYLTYNNKSHPAAEIIRKGNIPYLRLTDATEILELNGTYDSESDSVIFTTPKSVYQLKVGQDSAFKNGDPLDTDVLPSVKENDRIFIAIDWIVSHFPYEKLEGDTARTTFLYADGYTIQQATFKEGLSVDERRLRSEATLTAPFYETMEESESFYILNDEGRYVKVTTKDGISGYVKASVIELNESTVISTKVKKEKGDFPLPFDKRFIVAWEGIYSREANQNGAQDLTGVDVYAPTWFELTDDAGTVSSLATRDYVKAVKESNAQVWALFSNVFDPERTNKVIGSYEKRAFMIEQLMEYAESFKLDGINIDFENVLPEDGPSFTQFIRELVPYAHEQGLVISVDITFLSSSGEWSGFYERAKLSELADYIMVMAYDEHWANSPVAGSVASLPWVERNLERLLEVIPNDNLILGIPLYARLWTEEKIESGGVSLTSKALTMNEVETFIDTYGLQPVLDEDTGQYYVEYAEEDTSYQLWIENEHSLNQRLNLAKKEDLAGIAVWSSHFAEDEVWPFLDSELQKE
ncbi:glycosyl hydrolase family 18 protein [Thalassobacillus hwangdonensis]|uniref:Glycosyl hydrolase family 18 protein n=1 Tax=Thalassobacillus hwangdonensis TaxID=546108 RepID=A0ABW3KYL5_9BACI